jgi:hypothetical protein
MFLNADIKNKIKYYFIYLQVKNNLNINSTSLTNRHESFVGRFTSFGIISLMLMPSYQRFDSC